MSPSLSHLGDTPSSNSSSTSPNFTEPPETQILLQGGRVCDSSWSSRANIYYRTHIIPYELMQKQHVALHDLLKSYFVFCFCIRLLGVLRISKKSQNLLFGLCTFKEMKSFLKGTSKKSGIRKCSQRSPDRLEAARMPCLPQTCCFTDPQEQPGRGTWTFPQLLHQLQSQVLDWSCWCCLRQK